MSKEALRTQLDALQTDYRRIEAENARLRDDHPDIAAGLEAEAEIERLTKRNQQLESENAELYSTIETVEGRLRELMDAAEDKTKRIEELSEDLAKSQCEYEDIAEENVRLTNAVREISESKELEILRAVNEERRRFDDREERLLRQIADLEKSPPDVRGRLDYPKEGTPDPVTGKETPLTHEKRLGESGKAGESMTGPSREPHPLAEDRAPNKSIHRSLRTSCRRSPRSREIAVPA